MQGIRRLKEPSECSEPELAEFERLVRIGFSGSDDSLPLRVRSANCLAFLFDPETGVVAIAGLKQPNSEYTAGMFANAGCNLVPDGWGFELGWVFVSPTYRGAGIAMALCEALLERLGNSPVFATTRPDNFPMIKILEALGFEWAGRPFPRRSQEYLLYLRSGRSSEGVQ